MYAGNYQSTSDVLLFTACAVNKLFKSLLASCFERLVGKALLFYPLGDRGSNAVQVFFSLLSFAEHFYMLILLKKNSLLLFPAFLTS